MTRTQINFVEMIQEWKQLSPEVNSALELLKAEEVEPKQLASLILVLSGLPDKDDAEYAVGGVIRG